jgi:hypothetical protein
MHGRRKGDDAQLLMLAGIVLTISFILTALTLSQVAALEKEAAQDAPSPIIGEWRFLHERLASNLRTAVTPETTTGSFESSVLPTLGATFRALAAEKGYDFVLRAAGDGRFAGTGNEASLFNAAGTHYANWTYDGAVHFTHAIALDPDHDDGVVWEDPCPDASGPAAGCISGVYLFMRLADGSTSIEESVLFEVNHP